MKAPTKRPTKESTEVPKKVSSQVVEVHQSCFHLFCSLAIHDNRLNPSATFTTSNLTSFNANAETFIVAFTNESSNSMKSS